MAVRPLDIVTARAIRCAGRRTPPGNHPEAGASPFRSSGLRSSGSADGGPRFWSRMQVELLKRKPWRTRGRTRERGLEYLEIFRNRQRRHSALGMLTHRQRAADADARQWPNRSAGRRNQPTPDQSGLRPAALARSFPQCGAPIDGSRVTCPGRCTADSGPLEASRWVTPDAAATIVPALSGATRQSARSHPRYG